MKYFTSEILFKNPFDQTMSAVWQRYPNPFSRHVLSEDTILRRVEGPLLFTKRVLLKTNPIPKWGQRFVHMRHVVIVEESILDRDNRIMITYTRNVCGAKTISAVEKCTYWSTSAPLEKIDKSIDKASEKIDKSEAEKIEWTRLKREAWIDSQLRGFSTVLQRFGIERYKHNANNASKGLAFALARLFPPASINNSKSNSSSNAPGHLMVHKVESATVNVV